MIMIKMKLKNIYLNNKKLKKNDYLNINIKNLKKKKLKEVI